MVTARELMYTEVPLTSLTNEQLRARVARAQLYLLEVTTSTDSDATPERLRDRLAYFYKLESEGRLFGFGPVDADPGGCDHLAIIAASTGAEADRIASNEPMQRAGIATIRVRNHTMNEGVACYVGRALSRRAEALGDSFDPAIDGIGLSHEALQQRASRAQVHLIHLEPTDKPRPREDTQTGYDHFVWLRGNEMQAKLMSCGPVQSVEPLPEGVWGGGLGVVATSREEAEKIAAEEPSRRAGYRRLSVQSWRLDFGLAAPIAKALATLNSLPT